MNTNFRDWELRDWTCPTIIIIIIIILFITPPTALSCDRPPTLTVVPSSFLYYTTMPISDLLKSLQKHHDVESSTSVLPNILIIITDQERAMQHWPHDFSHKHLPSMERLKKHGIDFQQHYTNSCMCSPSRATLLTSQFPVQTGVTR